MSKIRQDLIEYIDENVEEYLKGLTLHVVSKLPGQRTTENTIALTSAGATVTVIPNDMPFVYQAFISPVVFNRVRDFYDILGQHPEARRKYVIPGRAVEPGVMEYKKITPLNEFTADIPAARKRFIRANKDAIKRDIYNALGYLHELGITHGDPRIDNVGYDEEHGIFVLFDFDKVKLHGTLDDVESDMYMFDTSLRSAMTRPRV